MLGNLQRSLVSPATGEEEVPGESEEAQGTDGQGEPVEGGVESAELQGHHTLRLRQAGGPGRKLAGRSYLDKGVAHEHRGHRLDDGADDEVGRREVEQEDVVGGGGEGGQVSQDDEDEDVCQRTKHCEEHLGENQHCCQGPVSLHHPQSVGYNGTIVSAPVLFNDFVLS